MKRVHLLLLVILSALLFACQEDDIAENNTGTLDNTGSEASNFITVQEAETIAKQFINVQDLFIPATKSKNLIMDMVYTDLSNEVETKSGQQEAYYIFNIEKGGFVIVAADKRALPVLGYSTESKFDPKEIPANMKDVLIDYKSEINYARDNGVKDLVAVAQIRENILNGVTIDTKAGYKAPIQPLLGRIEWNQSPYYNAYCPNNTPVGCVATAMSQIMYYWEYPNASEGYHSYTHPTYGSLYYNYNRDINWNAMQPEMLRSPNNEIASFCYGVAVSLEMNFGPRGSGTQQYYVPASLAEFYKYPAGIENLARRNYETSEWTQMIYDELKSKRPVQYAGYGSGGGHSFVCDGYSNNGYFHFNWGWGGVSNGYFLLNALNPSALGDGGGNGGFNDGQQAIFGFKPPSDVNPTPDLDAIEVPYGLNSNNATDSEIDLSWNRANGADTYTIEVREKYSHNWTRLQSNTNSIKVTGLDATTLYEWRVRGENNTNIGDYSSIATFRTTAQPVDPTPEPVGDYCVSRSYNADDAYIRKISMGNMSNYSYGNADGYEDFTYRTIYANSGSRVSFTFTPTFSGYSKTAYWCVWIDLNNNGEFESSERFARLSGRYSVYGSLNIPSSLQSGDYRVRISMKLSYYPSPCETFATGEVEDYTLTVR